MNNTIEEMLRPECIEEYLTVRSRLHSEVASLIATIRCLETLESVPWGGWFTPTELGFFSLLESNFFQVAVITACRLKENPKKQWDLEKARRMLTAPVGWTKPEFLFELRKATAKPKARQGSRDTWRKLGDLRNQSIAHLDRDGLDQVYTHRVEVKHLSMLADDLVQELRRLFPTTEPIVEPGGPLPDPAAQLGLQIRHYILHSHRLSQFESGLNAETLLSADELASFNRLRRFAGLEANRPTDESADL